MSVNNRFLYNFSQSLDKFKFPKKQLVLFFILLLFSLIALSFWARSNQKKNNDNQARSIKENIQYLLPPLVRQEQRISSLDEQKLFTYKVRSVIDGLKKDNRFVNVVLENTLVEQDISNIDADKDLQEIIKRDVYPIPVEYIVANNLGQSVAVANIYIDAVEEKFFTFDLFVYLFFALILWIISVAILYGITLRNENINLRLKNENYQLKALYDLVDETVQSELSNDIGNEIQILNSYFARIDAELDDIHHDAIKAPLLAMASVERNRDHQYLIQRIEGLLKTKETEDVCKSIVEFILDTSLSISTLQFMLDEMREFAKPVSKSINVYETIQDLLNNLPPTIRSKPYCQAPVLITDQSTFPQIRCNPYHLKKILKNAIYNSNSSIRNIYKKDRSFIGKIELSIKTDRDKVIIEVSDNGEGYTDEIIGKLYQNKQRLNQNSGRGQGSLIVNALLTHNSGQVKLSNNDQGGACCQFLFPKVS